MKQVPLRICLYVYVAAGVIGLLQGWLMWPFVAVLAIVLIGVTWENLGRPISARRWLPFVLVATLGIARVIFIGPPTGSTG